MRNTTGMFPAWAEQPLVRAWAHYRAIVKLQRQALEEVLGRPIKLSENLPDNMGATDDWLLAHAKLEALALVLWRDRKRSTFPEFCTEWIKGNTPLNRRRSFRTRKDPSPRNDHSSMRKVLAESHKHGDGTSIWMVRNGPSFRYSL